MFELSWMIDQIASHPSGIAITDDDQPEQCHVCDGSGKLAIRARGVPASYESCPECLSARTTLLLDAIPREFQRDFADYYQIAKTAPARTAGRLSETWAKSGEGSILFRGSVGTLKTTLASACYRERIRAGRAETAVWITAADLLQDKRDSYSQQGGALYNAAITCDLLLIDDIGIAAVNARNSDWVQEALYQVIGTRYNHQRPIIFTTNCSRDDLRRQVGEAVTSRLFGMCGPNIILTAGPDVRYEQ